MSEPRKCFDAEAYKNAVAYMRDAGFDGGWLDKLDISGDIGLAGQYYCADDVEGIIDLKNRSAGVGAVWTDRRGMAHRFIPFGDLPKGVRIAMGLESAAEKSRSTHIDPWKYYKDKCKGFTDHSENDRCRGYIDQCIAQREIKGYRERTYELVRSNGKKITSLSSFQDCLSMVPIYALYSEEPGVPDLKDNGFPTKLIYDSLQLFYGCENSKDSKCVAQAKAKAVEGLTGKETEADRIERYKEGRIAHRRTAEERREDEQYYKSYVAAADEWWQRASCLINLAEKEDVFPGGIDPDDLKKIVNKYEGAKPMSVPAHDFSAGKYLESSREMIEKLVGDPSGYESLLDNNGSCGCHVEKEKIKASGCKGDEEPVDGEKLYIKCENGDSTAGTEVVYSEPYCAAKSQPDHNVHEHLNLGLHPSKPSKKPPDKPKSPYGGKYW